jgi:adenosylcobinamide kinase / adenosylcobinamide-phosphate guanylyltransferase
MSKRVLILGGARSGKSTFALSEASALHGKKAFLATAEALDDEMAVRIARHRSERSPEWDTFEEPVELPSLISRVTPDYPVLLVDCLTLWVSNILLRGLPFPRYADQFLEAITNRSAADIYMVSNEVGLGLVPDVPVGRQYRDDLGRLNANIAATATDVYFMVAGIPMKIKGA